MGFQPTDTAQTNNGGIKSEHLPLSCAPQATEIMSKNAPKALAVGIIPFLPLNSFNKQEKILQLNKG